MNTQGITVSATVAWGAMAPHAMVTTFYNAIMIEYGDGSDIISFEEVDELEIIVSGYDAIHVNLGDNSDTDNAKLEN
jgi:hypothetical protein